MAENRRFVKVFLASPSDLGDERKSAKSVADETNDLLAEEFGYQVELVGWEDTIASFGRPQAIINRDVDRCELFVGLMWKRWGTPPDVLGPYSSGFEEEFNRSVDRKIKTGNPEISLMFKEIDSEFLSDPGEDLKKVLDFKKRLIDEKKIYFEEFSDIRDFETKFRRCIVKYIRSLKAEELAKVSGQSQAPTSANERQQAAEGNNQVFETPLSVEGAKFLREFISKTENENEQELIEGVEIARFRLLSSIVGNRGNDNYSIGVHDANLIFSKDNHFKLGNSELRGLIASGLDRYHLQTVPLWRWLIAVDGLIKNILPLYTIVGPAKRRINAFAAMMLISEPIPSNPQDARDLFLNSWFAKKTASDLKVAALNYLGEYGISADLTIIRQEIDRNDNQTINAANEAFIQINLRESRERAILALYELQPTTIKQSLLAVLFNHEASLSTDMLLNGIGHRNSDIRRIVAELLCLRSALPTDVAEQLFTDSDVSVRYTALRSLVDSGRKFSIEEAKAILIKPMPSALLSVRSAILDTANEDCLNQFIQERLKSKTDKELEMICSENSILDQGPQFILAERQFKRRGEDLRKAVDNQYKKQFDEWILTMEDKYPGSVGIGDKTKRLENYIRKDLTRKALDIICKKREYKDLGRVREALKSGFVDYSSVDVEYLRKFGEWEDIPLIIDSLKRPESGRKRTLLSGFDDDRYQTAARAIYALGQTRLPEILAMSIPTQLLVCLIREISDKVFRRLSDVSILLALRSEDEVVRRSVALKSVCSLPKRRVAKLLDKYLSGDEDHYYNVIHWLDFGTSVPRDRALPAARKALKKE